MEWEMVPIVVPITTIRYEHLDNPQGIIPNTTDTMIQDGYRLGMTSIRICDDYAYMGAGLLQNLIRLGYSEVTVHVCYDPMFKRHLVAQGFLDG